MMMGLIRESGTPVQLVSMSEEDRWIEIFRGVSERSGITSEETWFIAGMILATRSHRVRDAAALALVDLRARDAGASILEVLRRPDTAGHSGTLLYAIGELGLPIPLSILVQIVADGSYEARAMALQVLQTTGFSEATAADVDGARNRLQQIADIADDPETSEAAQIAVQHLPETNKASTP